jgi:hypothetical protein
LRTNTRRYVNNVGAGRKWKEGNKEPQARIPAGHQTGQGTGAKISRNLKGIPADEPIRHQLKIINTFSEY